MRRNKFTATVRPAAIIVLTMFSLNGFAAPQTYEAVAKPVISTTIRFGYNDAFRGVISHVARPGTIVRGPVRNTDDSVADPGDILVQMKTRYRWNAVQEKLANLKSAQANMKSAKANYLRYKVLLRQNATTLETYQSMEANYFSSVGAVEAAENEVELARVMLDCCMFRAPFDAVVDEVYFPAGLCAGELDIVRISQLTPMGIKVKMDRATAAKITSETPIAVYPCNSDKPAGVFHGESYLLPDGIMLKVDNYPLPPAASTEKNGEKIPLCRTATAIPYHYYHSNRPDRLMVPEESLEKDGQGYFVWRGVGQRENQVQGISPVFEVEKVRLVPDDLKTEVNATAFYRILKDPGSLKEFNIVLLKPPADLKERQRVCVRPARYRFMPGDPVKVRIGE